MMYSISLHKICDIFGIKVKIEDNSKHNAFSQKNVITVWLKVSDCGLSIVKFWIMKIVIATAAARSHEITL